MTPEQLDALLDVLRRHKVSHYTLQGPQGCISIALEPTHPEGSPADPSLAERRAREHHTATQYGPRT
jgi:hypothetical protein